MIIKNFFVHDLATTSCLKRNHSHTIIQLSTLEQNVHHAIISKKLHTTTPENFLICVPGGVYLLTHHPRHVREDYSIWDDNFSQLEFLPLYINQLSGTIQSEIDNLSQLAGLDLDNNQLSGTIPSGIGENLTIESSISFING